MGNPIIPGDGTARFGLCLLVSGRNKETNNVQWRFQVRTLVSTPQRELDRYHWHVNSAEKNMPRRPVGRQPAQLGQRSVAIKLAPTQVNLLRLYCTGIHLACTAAGVAPPYFSRQYPG